MHTLVFITHDVTPEQWADFANAAGCPPSGSDNKIYIPYILVHSPSQQDLENTERIDATAKTQFSSAKWEEIKGAFDAISEPHSRSINTVDFLILDQQSHEDRKVIIMEKSIAHLTPEGEESTGGDDLTKYIVWKRYRVPFEEAFTVQCAFEGFCDPQIAEEYFEEVDEKEVAPVEEEEEPDESSDSDDSKDSEYFEYHEK